MRCTSVGLALAMAASLAAAPLSIAMGAELPDYLKPISGPPQTPSAEDLATRDVLQLNISMFSLYENAGATFRRNILGKHPVILALFSGSGGRMVLYRPGQLPTEAPSVPKVYQMMKSLGHSTMAVSEVVLPYVGSPNDRTGSHL